MTRTLTMILTLFIAFAAVGRADLGAVAGAQSATTPDAQAQTDGPVQGDAQAETDAQVQASQQIAQTCPASIAAGPWAVTEQTSTGAGVVSEMIFNPDHTVIQFGPGLYARGSWQGLNAPAPGSPTGTAPGPSFQGHCEVWLARPEAGSSHIIRTYFAMDVGVGPDGQPAWFTVSSTSYVDQVDAANGMQIVASGQGPNLRAVPIPRAPQF